MPGPSWSLKQLSISDADNQRAPLTPVELDKIVQLAGLTVPSDRVAQLHSDVSTTINWMGQIRHVDTTGVEPMFTPLQQHTPAITLPVRPDAVSEGGQAPRLLSNAQRKEGQYFVAPKVVDHDDS